MSGNQYTPDPRQTLFLKYYLDPKSGTFSNAYQSAIKAEYAEEYAKNLTGQMPDWLSESINTEKLLKKAENNLEEVLDMESGVIADRNGKLVEADDLDVVKVKLDASKFVASRLGKTKWSDRTEYTGKDGKDLIPQPILSNVRSDNSNKEDNNPQETD